MDVRAFGPVWVGSGTLGFFGEGYWYHRFVPNLSFKRATFVAKTTSVAPKAGGMPLTERFTPKELFPRSIVLRGGEGIALNAVALSGPGLPALLETGRWQSREGPFFISLMPIELTARAQQAEMKEATEALRKELPNFRSKQVGIQLNISSPNAGVDLQRLVTNAHALLEELAPLGLNIVVKLGLTTSPMSALGISRHPACAGLCIANGLPFGQKLDPNVWKHNFPNGSPLKNRGLGEGSLTGSLLLPLVEQWLRDFRWLDKKTYVNAGGGIMHKRDVVRLKQAGANSISFATVAMLRPWRVPSIIRTAHEIF
ncbi:MAG: hypothetical protein ABA06_03585 [Parcubacteria bacterium C7867-001]|nr:MAG: hypothetical protein ABA06_03585 [Parcubacteria bacterium C7867-001]